MPTLSLLRRAAVVAVVLLAGLAARPASLEAQQYDVRGIVVDSAHAPLSGVMVVALTRTDSVIATFATSGGSGAYMLRRLAPGDYILQLTRIGSRPFRRDFSIVDRNITADTVVMVGAGPIELAELVVNSEHVPIVNKPDTLEYNADAFKTRINATVEELLKLLPGISVSSDGAITAQGKQVQQVLVDGKEFFGNDPKMATRNLPSAAIDKVQVLERKSDAAQFSGIDDGQEQTTVNLVLKPNARVGYFGRAVAGGGPAPRTEAAFAGSKGDDLRYTGSLNLNRFSPSTQLSLIANRNNVGQSGFSIGQPMEFVGGRVSGGGGRDGFSETMAIGVNGSRQFAANSWLRGSYFLSTSDNRTQAVTDEQLLQGEAVAAVRAETATGTSDNLSHRLNLNAQHAFAPWTQLRFRGNFSATSSTTGNLSQQETRLPDGTFQNSAISRVASESDNLSGDGRFTFSQRFNQAGRTLVAEAWGNLSEPDQFTNLNSSTELAGPGGPTTRDVLQSQRRDSRTLTTGQRLALTEPLGRGAVLEVFGQHRAIAEDQHYDVRDLVDGTSIPNTDLSRAFERTYTYLQGGTRLSRNTAALRWVVGLEVQSSDLQGTIIGRDESIDNGFTNLLPSANLRYQFNQGNNITVNYRTSTRDPSLNELQPFVDNTDPLRIYAGNPDLTPQYQHNLRADFRRFDQFSFRSIYVYANVGYNRNQIVQSREVDAQGRQTVMPVNLGDGWNTNLGGSYGTPIRALGAQVDLEYGFTRSVGLELVNGVENTSRTADHSVGLRLQNRSKGVFDLSGGARWGFNSVRYSINRALDRSYLNSTYYGEGTWFITEAWSVNASGSYQVYDQELFGPRDNILLLGASVGLKMFDNRGELRLQAVDLLDENNGISITTSSSSIRQRQAPTLGRRVMMQFSYQLGSNLAPPAAGRR